jgi:hypothetical protein
MGEARERGWSIGMGRRRSEPKAKRKGEDQGEMFFKTILNFRFKKILNSFLNSVKTTHHIKNATA